MTIAVVTDEDRSGAWPYGFRVARFPMTPAFTKDSGWSISPRSIKSVPIIF
jgi:hypothetical protein